MINSGDETQRTKFSKRIRLQGHMRDYIMAEEDDDGFSSRCSGWRRTLVGLQLSDGGGWPVESVHGLQAKGSGLWWQWKKTSWAELERPDVSPWWCCRCNRCCSINGWIWRMLRPQQQLPPLSLSSPLAARRTCWLFPLPLEDSSGNERKKETWMTGERVEAVNLLYNSQSEKDLRQTNKS